ncbi:Anaphase-promoting complex (APC) subunit 11 protein [Dioscorea alata]|uniref:Anaphase-promoting complex (APC) subunit 11 protein n=1 Tax=Dioscorea alata TaxID=55571 RepID=A0ACB7UMM5_DIOAL|nr:Anaphase-promoting complex (APC) subunit 11 protein [Dioscorea alata]
MSGNMTEPSITQPQSTPISLRMEETKEEKILSSAAAFVEGGLQDACGDACSICLEDFCDSDPSTVTNCKHEFHLQCILEWCQRSSQCPMCWQALSLKDPISQELLEGVERERNLRASRSRSTAFYHPALGDFELQHLPLGPNDAELEERIFQHLAAAAAMGRTQHIARRDGQRGRSAARGRPQYVVFSTNSSSVPATSGERGESETTATTVSAGSGSSGSVGNTLEESIPQAQRTTQAQTSQVASIQPGPSSAVTARPVLSHSRSSVVHSTQDRAGPSDFQSFSETLKSRFNAVSLRYKESIANSTRGWKERFFSRNTSTGDLHSDARRDVNTEVATVSRMMERLGTRNGIQATSPSLAQSTEDHTHSSVERVSDNSANPATNGHLHQTSGSLLLEEVL